MERHLINGLFHSSLVKIKQSHSLNMVLFLDLGVLFLDLGEGYDHTTLVS